MRKVPMSALVTMFLLSAYAMAQQSPAAVSAGSAMELMKSVALAPRIVGEKTLELRAIFNRPWLDVLGGVERGLYTVKNGAAFETLYIVEAVKP